MTKKERMLAAIRREPQDRIPTQIDFSPQMLDLVSRHYGVPLKNLNALMTAFNEPAESQYQIIP